MSIYENAVALRKMNQLWRNPEERKRFEAEAGLAPIENGDSLKVEAQHQEGLTEAYHAKFREWAMTQIDA